MVSSYGPLLYQIGMADTNQRNEIQNRTDQIVQNIRDQKFSTARQARGNACTQFIESLNILKFIEVNVVYIDTLPFF